MAGFNREELRSLTKTTAAALDTQQQDHDRVRPKGGGGNFHTISEGDNIFRIAPFHPHGGGKTYSEALTTARLMVRKPKRDQSGNVIEGQFELGPKYVFNARVHGGFPIDLVEVYMDIARRIAIPNFIQTDEEFGKINRFIVGDQKEFGIKPQDSWVVWAMKSLGKDDNGNHVWSEWKRLQLKVTMKNKMKERGAEINRPDPYTDIDEGIPVIIWKAPKLREGEKRKADDWYKVKLEQVIEGLSTRYLPAPLTDRQIEEWMKLKPLHTLYVNSFKRSDLELQIEGLKNLDEDLASKGFPIQVTQYDEFLEAAEKLYEMVPEGETQSEDEEQQEEEPQQNPAPVISTKRPVQNTVPPIRTTNPVQSQPEVEVRPDASDKVKKFLDKIKAKNAR